MGAPNFFQMLAFGEGHLKQRVNVDQENWTGSGNQRGLQIRDYIFEHCRGERMKQEQDGRLVGKDKFLGIETDRLKVEAALAIVFELANVFLSNAVEVRQ